MNLYFMTKCFIYGETPSKWHFSTSSLCTWAADCLLSTLSQQQLELIISFDRQRTVVQFKLKYVIHCNLKFARQFSAWCESQLFYNYKMSPGNYSFLFNFPTKQSRFIQNNIPPPSAIYTLTFTNKQYVHRDHR